MKMLRILRSLVCIEKVMSPATAFGIILNQSPHNLELYDCKCLQFFEELVQINTTYYFLMLLFDECCKFYLYGCIHAHTFLQTLELIDVYCFGHLLYEMTFGQQLDSPTCDSYSPSCPAQIRESFCSLSYCGHV